MRRHVLRMMGLERFLIWGIGCAVVCASASSGMAAISDNPYHAIVERNVFSLKPKLEKPTSVDMTLPVGGRAD